MSESQRFDDAQRDELSPRLPSDASVGQRAWLLHHGPMYTFFDMARRRRDRGPNTSFLVGLLLVQVIVVVGLVLWLL